MLARTFLSAEELGLTEPQRVALVAVLGMFERGEIDQDHFDMHEWWMNRARDRRGRFCGTAGCIGGWAEYAAGGQVFDRLSPPSWGKFEVGLWELLHPTCESAWHASPWQATEALANYLAIGNPKWPEVMGEPGNVRFGLSGDFFSVMRR